MTKCGENDKPLPNCISRGENSANKSRSASSGPFIHFWVAGVAGPDTTGRRRTAPLSAKERIHRQCRNFANRNREVQNSSRFTIGNPLATIVYRKTHTSDNHLDHRLEFAPLYVHIVNRFVPSPSHRCCSSTNWYENVYE